MKLRKKPLIAASVFIVGIALIGWRVNTARHQPLPAPHTVTTRLGEITVSVSETGTIEPVNKVDVKSKVAGRLLSIPIQEGQTVRQGQLIALVDRTLIDPQIARARAQLAQAQAGLQQSIAEYGLQQRQTRAAILQAEAGLHTAQTHLAAVAAPARPQEFAQQQQNVKRAQIALQDAQRTQTRKQSLLAKGFIPQAEADASQVAVDTAASNLTTAEQQLALTAAGPRTQDIEDAKAQVESARVQVASAKENAPQDDVKRLAIGQARATVVQSNNDLAQLLVNLNDTRIIAPASGIVLKKYKQPTEIVQSATTGFSDQQSIVATLGDQLMVRVGINEVDIPKVKLKAPVKIHIDAVPETTFNGFVQEIAPASTNAFPDTSGTSTGQNNGIAKFSVKILLARYDARLRPGMSASVDIISAHHANIVLAPLEAIPFSGAHGTVMVYTPAKIKETRLVTLGLRNDTDAEILNGLKPGEKLVIPAIDGKERRTIDFGGPGGP